MAHKNQRWKDFVMKLEKVNKKIVMTFIIILLIISVILITTLIVIYNSSDIAEARNKLAYIYNDEWNNEEFPDGMPKFYRSYEGNLSAPNIGKSIYYVVTEVIPNYNQLFKDKNDDEIEKYYDDNVENIALTLGIDSKEDFKDFVKKILEINVNEFNIEEFYIDGESIKSVTAYSKADLHVKYYESDEIILKFKVLKNKLTDKSSIQYSK